MLAFDLPGNIRKPNISYSLIRTCTCAYQGVRMLGFLMFSRGSKGNTGKKRNAPFLMRRLFNISFFLKFGLKKQNC